MKLSKITDKSIICEGCRTRYTINYPKNEELTKVSKCSTCGKVNMTKIIKRKRIKL
jgi:DNA replicative helicase MCM subunit Mcm2 (Cdc46/Mcm family)